MSGYRLGHLLTENLKSSSPILDYLRTIRDPEKPQTLEDLNVVYEHGIFVQKPTPDNVYVVRIEFNPTVPHCSLATLIGLCIRIKIERNIPHKLKLDIFIKKGTHETENESEYRHTTIDYIDSVVTPLILQLNLIGVISVNKQINDKERIAAGMENPNLKNLVEQCIADAE